MKDKKFNNLLEWYDEYRSDQVPQQDPHQNALDIPDRYQASVADNPPNQIQKPEEEKPEEKAERVENWAELYKALVMTKVLEAKFSMLSSSFGKTEDDKTKAKQEIKEIVKKIVEVVDKL